MGALVGITSVKRFTYRGQPEEFSNTYHFTGAVPADFTAWRALYDALVAQEKTVMPSGVSLIGGYGYDDDAEDAHSVWSVDLTQAPNSPVNSTGNFDPSTAAPGDAACWVRWKTSRKNSAGKWIYLRKYFHGVRLAGASGGDTIAPLQITALNAFGAKMEDGTFLDGRKLRSRTHDETLQGHGVSSYATTRTLKRRGRRPH